MVQDDIRTIVDSEKITPTMGRYTLLYNKSVNCFHIVVSTRQGVIKRDIPACGSDYSLSINAAKLAKTSQVSLAKYKS